VLLYGCWLELKTSGNYIVHAALGVEAYRYSEEERLLFLQTAMRFKQGQGVIERDDMSLYVKAAVAIYELSRELKNVPTRFVVAQKRTADEWFRILTAPKVLVDTTPYPKQADFTLDYNTGGRHS